MENYFYVYKDEEDRRYYLSAKTKKTTYIKPKNKTFLDPETNEEYVFSSDDDSEEEDKKENSKEDSEPKIEEENEEKVQENEEKVEENEEKVQENEQEKEEKKEKDHNKQKRTVYFVYEDSKNELYYYNTETKQTTYTKPKNAKFLDPDTETKYIFKNSEKKEKKEKKDKKEKKEKKEKKLDNDSEPTSPKQEEDKKTKDKPKRTKFSNMAGQQTPSPKPRRDPGQKALDRRASGINFGDMIIDVPDEVSTFKYEPPKETTNHQSFFPDIHNLALPANLQEDIQKFQVDDYAKHFFKEHRSHHIFSRKKVSPEALASFQDTPLTGSLLTSIPKNYEKSAIQMFNIILGYTGVLREKGRSSNLIQLFSIVDSSPILRDELYFQLIKQTNNNPNDDALLKTWQIFVIVASIYPSSLDSEVWIKSHLSREALKQSKPINDYAQFTYIRFCARCAKGKQMDIAPMYATRLYKDVYESKKVFGASIYEQLWNQRTTHKYFPIPRYVHEMAELLLKKGAEQTEGIFRHVGNKKNVTNYEDRINEGSPLDQNINIHDLASLFKSWFSMLPDPLIPNSYIPDLKNAFEDGSFIPFVRKLPKAHLYTLKYIIGFFQKLVKSEEVTKMTAGNLAICFGPDIVSTQDVKDLSAFEKFKNISIKLLSVLIKDLVTDDIYPLLIDE